MAPGRRSRLNVGVLPLAPSRPGVAYSAGDRAYLAPARMASALATLKAAPSPIGHRVSCNKQREEKEHATLKPWPVYRVLHPAKNIPDSARAHRKEVGQWRASATRCLKMQWMSKKTRKDTISRCAERGTTEHGEGRRDGLGSWDGALADCSFPAPWVCVRSWCSWVVAVTVVLAAFVETALPAMSRHRVTQNRRCYPFRQELATTGTFCRNPDIMAFLQGSFPASQHAAHAVLLRGFQHPICEWMARAKRQTAIQHMHHAHGATEQPALFALQHF